MQSTLSIPQTLRTAKAGEIISFNGLFLQAESCRHCQGDGYVIPADHESLPVRKLQCEKCDGVGLLFCEVDQPTPVTLTLVSFCECGRTVDADGYCFYCDGPGQNDELMNSEADWTRAINEDAYADGMIVRTA